MYKKSKSGFTLVEVMIATAILLVTTGAFLDLLVQCANLIETGRPQDMALSAAQAKLEEIAQSNLSNIMNYNSPPQNSFPVSGLTAPLGQTNPGAVVVAQVGTSNLFDVTITVSWQEKGGNRSRTLSTTLARR